MNRRSHLSLTALLEDVIESVRTSFLEPGELGRLECRKGYDFEAVWNGVVYRTKQARPIFVAGKTTKSRSPLLLRKLDR